MNGHAERPCPREEEAVAWALHALEPDEELAFRQHLPGCPSCRAAVRDAEEVLTGLGASVDQVAPPPALRDTLLARAAETPQEHASPAPQAADPPPAPAAVPQRTEPRPTPTEWLPRRGRQLVAAALALVAVVAIGGLAVRNAQLQQQRDAEAAQSQRVTDLLQELARPGTQHALLSTDDGTTVAAVVVADGQREIYTVGMPPNEADSTTYVLWGVPAGAAPQALGTFDVTGTGEGPRTVGSGGEADSFAAYAISLEQGSAAPASPSTVMAQGQVAI
ncbi:anti-sigma factor [Pseudonocardia sichuanensis]